MFLTPGSSSPTTCKKIICGIPPPASLSIASVRSEVSSVEALDTDAVMRDVEALFVDSQKCWPADDGNYGPFFYRLEWNCSGSYRGKGGSGGCAGGRQRFEPERSWADNTNLDEARALLRPVKEEYGENLSLGDLFTLAGTMAIHGMGGQVTLYCAGRSDSEEGHESLILGPDEEQERFARCE